MITLTDKALDVVRGYMDQGDGEFRCGSAFPVAHRYRPTSSSRSSGRTTLVRASERWRWAT